MIHGLGFGVKDLVVKVQESELRVRSFGFGTGSRFSGFELGSRADQC